MKRRYARQDWGSPSRTKDVLGFADYEREGWERNAVDYDALDLPATRQAIAPLLDSVGELHGRRVLEIACGTGHLAEYAVARGAAVSGSMWPLLW